MNSETELSNKKCLPCEGGVDPINKDEALRFISKLDKDWKLSKDNKSI